MTACCRPISINLSSCLLALQLCFAAAAPAHAVESAVQFEIAAGNAADALSQFSQQSGLQMLFVKRAVAGHRTQAVLGQWEPKAALALLLKESGLTFEFVNERTVAIRDAQADDGQRATDANGAGTGDVHLARAQPTGQSAGSAEQVAQDNRTAAAGEDAATKIEEVVVTAQKRTERLQDVPVPVTAISGESLINNNQTQLQEYYARIPALSLVPTVWGPVIAIRGVTTGGLGSPTVGITVDDVPFGASTGAGGGGAAPDFDPSDLARVEVLRGPQGTFYGAASIGGLLKYVTLDPAANGFSGRLQAGTLSIKNGDGWGYNVRGSVDVPVSETFAIRASGFTRSEPGYIDDPGLGVKGVNQLDVDGGRVAALWRPSDSFSLKLSALIQDTHGEGTPDAFPALADLNQGYSIPGHGRYDRKMQAYSATLAAQLGAAQLTSITAYNINKLDQFGDATNGFAAISEPTFGFPYTDVYNLYETNKFTQEVRVAMPISSRIDWLVGAFYTRERTSAAQIINVVSDPRTLAFAGLWLDAAFPSTFTEYAAFTDFTFKITDRFDVQVGGRESRNRQTYTEFDTGGLVGGTYQVPEVSSRDNAFTYLVTPRLKISPDLMVYARLASGYRAGGPNTCNVVPSMPCHFGPDETTNWEVGVKGSTSDRFFSFDASVYYIDWKDIQLQLQDPTTLFVYFDNAGRAKSQGAELSVDLRPRPGMTLSGWIAWNQAELTEGFPPGGLATGVAGDRLPYSSPFSASVSLDQEFPLSADLSGFVGGSVSYVGTRDGDFVASAQLVRPTFPHYVRADLRAGLTMGAWTANLFVNNLADKRGLLSGNPVTSFTVDYIQPRTIGVNISHQW